MGTSKGFGQAALILAGGVIGSRVLGLVRNMVISLVFGTSPELDAYFAAFRIPDLVFQLLAGAALGSAFIPTFARASSEDDAWPLASSVLNLIVAASMVVAVAAAAAAPWLVPAFVPGFPPSLQNFTVRLTQL